LSSQFFSSGLEISSIRLTFDKLLSRDLDGFSLLDGGDETSMCSGVASWRISKRMFVHHEEHVTTVGISKNDILVFSKLFSGYGVEIGKAFRLDRFV